MKDFNLPSVIHRYFLEYLPRHKGLQSSTIRSYRDSLRLFPDLCGGHTPARRQRTGIGAP